MNLVNGLRFDNLRGDIYGGLTAAVVALPLALAFGVASGAGAIAGLYGAIFVGFFAAVFGGTPAQVSGPTGPMTVVMALIVTQYAHEPAMAFTVVLMGGLFQILFGIFRLGSYIRLMPYPVVSGFMSGIGCIIIILQIGPLFGHANPPGGTIPALLAFPGFAAHPVWDGLIVGVVSLAIVYLTPKAIARLVPTPIIALVAGTLLVLYLLPGASIIGDIPTGLPQPHLPTFTLEALPGMIQSALVLALLGAIDSLLTSLIADNVTRTHHESDRELIGQGIGNAVAGLFGAIPGAGATMRTVVNVRAGGRTPISGALHALVLLALVLGLAPLAEHIPHAVLAGILIKVGVDIIDWEYLRRIHRAPRAGVFFMLVVLALTVFVDLIMAVGVGVVMASLLFVKRMADLQAESMKLIVGPAPEADLNEAETAVLAGARGNVVVLQPGGPLSFGAAKEVGRRLTGLDEYDALVIDMTRVPMIDSSAALAIEDVIRQSETHGKPVLLCGLTPRVKRVMERLGVLKYLPPEHVKDDRMAALQAAATSGGPHGSGPQGAPSPSA